MDVLAPRTALAQLQTREEYFRAMLRCEGKHYNYFRDYDPAIGRYLESDPIGLLAGVNTYAYVDNNPLPNKDPSGLASAVSPGSWGQPSPGQWFCAQNPSHPSCQPNWVDPKLRCKVVCNAKYQPICTGLGLFVGWGWPKVFGAATGVGCIVIKLVICDHECDRNPYCV